MPRLLVPAACAMAALAGCGGDGGDEPGRTTTVERGQPARVTGHEYRFDPSTVVVLGATGEVRVRFVNAGTLAHNLRVFRGDRELGGTPTFQGGARSVTLKLAPGDYRMLCTVGDHADLGMRGSLRVRARN